MRLKSRSTIATLNFLYIQLPRHLGGILKIENGFSQINNTDLVRVILAKANVSIYNFNHDLKVVAIESIVDLVQQKIVQQ